MNSEDVQHPILSQPWKYRVTAYSFRSSLQHAEFDLTLENGKERVALRFLSVSQIEVDAGFPNASSGLQIIDMSSRGMEDARVRVCSFEQGPALRLWARSVERVQE